MEDQQAGRVNLLTESKPCIRLKYF